MIRTAFQVFAVHQALNLFLNLKRVRLESTGYLPYDLVNKVGVGHVLAILHDADNACLAEHGVSG